MQEWINSVLTSSNLGHIVLLAMLPLGILNAVTSVCNIAIIGALTGYAGAGENRKRGDTLVVALSFMLGTMLALILIGAAIGYAGQVVSGSLGRYGKILAGLVLIFFGLLALNLIPLTRLKLPKFDQMTKKYPKGMAGTMVFGFALGGASLTCNLSCCSPALAIVLGAASLQGQWVRSALMMGMYAIGYGLPLTAILLGLSYGKWTLRASKVMPAIKIVGGILLLAVGFYFLLTI